MTEMQASTQMIDALNALLADELTAIDQYISHRGRAAAWGYGVFVTYIDERIADEQAHAELLIKRIYELEGVPNTVRRNTVTVAADLFNGLGNDRLAEIGAVAKYNEAIALAEASGDNATRALLEGILKDEDDHLLDIEKRLVQIAQVQLAQWLSLQIG